MASSPRKDQAQRKLQWWIQIFLIQCNLILSCVGTGGLAVSLMTKNGFFSDLLLLDYYENFYFNLFLSCSVILIVIGWLGIFGSALSSKKFIITNALLLFVFEVGTTTYIIIMNVFSDYTNTGKLYRYMQNQMKNYNYLNKHIIDTLQTTLLCCGLDDVTTWDTRNEIPISCCRNNQTECRLGSPYLQTNGCFEEFVHRARYYAWLLFTILTFSGLFMNFGIALSYLEDRIINDKKKEKFARKDSLKIPRPTCALHTISQGIEDKGRDEVDNEKKKDEENTNEENNDTAKSEENHSSEKDNVKEAEPNTCRNICKDISNGRVNIDS